MECLESIIPHIPSKNMKESIAFMVDTFGFESINYSDRYSELLSGTQILGIVQAKGGTKSTKHLSSSKGY